MDRKRLDTQTVQNITEQFYSCFCGIDISELKQGIYFICSPGRDAKLKGFGRKYTLFIFVKDDLCVVSYSPKHAAFIETLKGCGIHEIVERVNHMYKIKNMQLMIFHDETVTQYGDARILRDTDYPLYETFFCAANHTASPGGWLYEYFAEKTAKEYMVGYIKNGRLVSVCDAPDMPYMEDKIQHTGIETLEEERKKGYAKCVTALAAHHLMENGICPQWECNGNNIASIKLAESIGYRKYGTAYIVEE